MSNDSERNQSNFILTGYDYQNSETKMEFKHHRQTVFSTSMNSYHVRIDVNKQSSTNF